MQTRHFGHTGLQFSEMSLGCSPLGGTFGAVTQQEANAVVRTALDLGINLFDVAPLYGETRAETVLGEALKGVPRDKYHLSTKVGRYGMESFDFSAKRVTHSVDESLARLHTDHIDLIICHDIEFVDIRQVVEECIPALRKVQEQGKVRFVGVSGLPLKIYNMVLAETNLDFVLSYCNGNLMFRGLNALAPAWHEQGIGIINASPLGMGLMTGRALPEWHPASSLLRETGLKAWKHCQERGADLAQLAMQFALTNPIGDTVLVGTASAEELKRNVACLQSAPDATLLQEVQEIIAPIQDQIWQSGRPENN